MEKLGQTWTHVSVVQLFHLISSILSINIFSNPHSVSHFKLPKKVSSWFSWWVSYLMKCKRKYKYKFAVDLKCTTSCYLIWFTKRLVLLLVFPIHSKVPFSNAINEMHWKMEVKAMSCSFLGLICCFLIFFLWIFFLLQMINFSLPIFFVFTYSGKVSFWIQMQLHQRCKKKINKLIIGFTQQFGCTLACSHLNHKHMIWLGLFLFLFSFRTQLRTLDEVEIYIESIRSSVMKMWKIYARVTTFETSLSA